MKVNILTTFTLELPEGPDKHHKNRAEARKYVEEWLLTELATFMELRLSDTHLHHPEDKPGPYKLVKGSITTYRRRELMPLRFREAVRARRSGARRRKEG